MTVYLVNILYLVLFLVLYWKDRRRMANGFLFFILLVLSGASLLRLAQDTQSEFLYFAAQRALGTGKLSQPFGGAGACVVDGAERAGHAGARQRAAGGVLRHAVR